LQHNGFTNVESLDGAFLTYSVLPKKLDNWESERFLAFVCDRPGER
jgi:hypothetical protein